MTTPQPDVVDVDRRETWPNALVALVARWDRHVAATQFTADLSLPDTSEAELASALEGHQLRAMHCTRLLAHEADQLRTQGLRVFEADLFDARLDRAHELGYLTDEQHHHLRARHLGVAEPARARGRRNRVYLCVGRAVLDDLAGVESLLGRWGGEGIYFSTAGLEEEPLLQSLGEPTVVVCALEVAGTQWPALSFPSLPTVFLAAVRGLNVAADLVLERAVTAREIEFLAQPGDAFYDAHSGLPRT